MNFIMIGLLLRETLDIFLVRLNMYLVYIASKSAASKNLCPLILQCFDAVVG